MAVVSAISGTVRAMHMHPRRRGVPGLADRLMALRRSVGLSQQVLATRAGISIPRLRDAELHGLATTETLTLLARTLGVSVDTLTGRSITGAATSSTATTRSPDTRESAMEVQPMR